MMQKNHVSVTRVTHGPKHHFFGYYDKCPWNHYGTLLLTMEVNFKNHFPSGEPAGIGVIDLGNKEKLRIVKQTRAWNWQQGAMLQWLPSQSNSRIIYNDLQDNRFVSVIYNVNTDSDLLLPRPVAAISRSGDKALSINFSRLYNTRKDYGYSGLPDPWQGELYPDNDGIYVMNLNTGKYHLILSTKQIVYHDFNKDTLGVRHWLNHLAFNEDGTRFCFLHRYEIPRLKRFGTRLFTASVDGTDLRCLWNSHVSHFDWRDNNHILAWAVRQRASSGIAKMKQSGLVLLKQNEGLYRRLKMLPFLRTRVYGGAFFLFPDTMTHENTSEIVGRDILSEDGHCSYSPNRRWILLDTYPDIDDHRHVLLYDVEREECFVVGSFLSPPKMAKELRCDLHARWDHTGTQACIDSMHEGSRQMYTLDLSPIVK